MDVSRLERYYNDNNYPIQYVNLIGIRDEAHPNTWNDKIGYWTADGLTSLYEGTTDPGDTYTIDPMNKKGCAHLFNGFHHEIWRIGQHHGYPALQQNRPVKIWRDKNENHKNDDDIIETGMFGINCHHGHLEKLVNRVGGYSAGCQVIRSIKDWHEFYDYLVKSGQTIFNYLLIDKDTAKNIL